MSSHGDRKRAGSAQGQSQQGQRGAVGSAQGKKAFDPLDPRSELRPDMPMKEFMHQSANACPLPLVADRLSAPLDNKQAHRWKAKVRYNRQQPMTCMLEVPSGASVWLGCLEAAENP